MNPSRKHPFNLLAAALAAAALISCGAAKAPHASPSASPVAVRPSESVPPSVSQRLKYFFFEAVRQQNLGHHDAAFSLLEHCRNINPDAAEVYFAQANYHSAWGNDSLALQLMRRAAELSPDNNVYLESLADANIRMSLFDDAIEAYEKLYDNNKERSDILNVLVRLYNQKRDYDAMISAIDRIEAVEGKSESTALAKMRVYSLKGDKKKEYEELKRLSGQYPADMNYRVMMGNWLLQNNRQDEALEEYRHVLAQEPGNLMAKMSMLDYHRSQGNDSIADELRDEILVSPSTPTSSKIAMIRSLVNENERNGGDSTQVLRLFDRILEHPQSTTDIHELYAGYMSLKNMPDDSISNILRKALQIEPDKVAIRLSIIQSLWSRQDYDGVIAMSKEAIEYTPDEMAFYYFLGLAHFQKDEKEATLEALTLGVSQINDKSDKALVSDLYAIMGDIYHDKGMKKEAYAAYDNSLQWKDDNWSCLNNYAYYLSLDGENLQKAEQMSYRTVKAEPTNATYLDTYAWILFMQERYEEAQIYIEQTLQNDTLPSGVVLEHAGDIHAKNNNLPKALEYWQKSLDAGNDSKALERKIRQKKYIPQ